MFAPVTEQNILQQGEGLRGISIPISSLPSLGECLGETSELCAVCHCSLCLGALSGAG